MKTAASQNARAELARRELARRSYAYYLEYTGGPAWIRTRFSHFVADAVQKFVDAETDKAYEILIIESPPQHGKSMTVTENFPSWYLGKHPGKSVITASYDSDYAEKFCRRNKEKIKAYGGRLFNLSIGAIDRAGEFEISGGRGQYIARGIMAGITGNPANLIIIDDPIKNQQEADSPAYKARLWEEWQSSIKSRLAAHSKVVLIMTPWTEDDLAARIMRTEKNYTLLRFPVEAEEEGDLLGRAPGDSLCPEIGKDNAWLADFKASYLADPQGGRRAWTALFQCSPRVEGGNMVHRDWWKHYHPDEIARFATEIVSVDATFKDKETSDFVSIQVWGKLGNDYYLRYCLKKRLNFPDTLNALRTVSALYPTAKATLIEDAANGSAIIQVLQRSMFVIPVTPLGGKISRVNAVSPAIQSGHVFLPYPEDAPWVEDYIDEWSAFPNGKNDDQVDCSSQALHYLIFSPGSRAENVTAEREGPDLDRLFDPYGISEEYPQEV